MGQFSDYFRAADAEIASLAIASGPQDCGFDTVEAKGIPPDVVLSQLIAFIRKMPWSPVIAPTRLLWPPEKTGPTSKIYERLPENSPLRDGPFLQELSGETRDALASVDNARLPELAAQWARIEEMSSLWDEDSLLELLNELVDLASSAQKAGDQLYCRSTL
jgi:hypothetical protein